MPRTKEEIFATTDEQPALQMELFVTETGGEGAASEETGIPWRNKLLAGAGFLVAVFAIYAAISNINGSPGTNAISLPPGVDSPAADEAPPDSLGLQFDDVRDQWNSVDGALNISSALRRLPETGELDSFLHRFDPQAELVGAYQDETDFLVALMVRASLDHPQAAILYLHMCHTVSPCATECIDSYQSEGLGGNALAEAPEGETTWDYDGNSWRLTIEDGWLTLRVLAPED